MEEIWKDIKGYEGLYQVSSFGRVKSLERVDRIGRKKHGKFLKEHINSGGYFNVALYSKYSVKKYLLIHRLVAQAFIPNPNDYPQVNHIDENKINNNVDNLEWCTSEYNLGFKNRRKKASKSTKKPIISISPNGIFRWETSATDFSKRTGIDIRNVNAVLKRKRKHTHGYCFMYAEELK